MRKEVERMKKSGLMGIVGLLLLVMAATPAMAAEVTNVTVNDSGLYLYDFSYRYVSPSTLALRVSLTTPTRLITYQELYTCTLTARRYQALTKQ